MTEELVIPYPPPEALADAVLELMMLTRKAYTAMRDARVERERHAPVAGAHDRRRTGEDGRHLHAWSRFHDARPCRQYGK